jgi:hypothetical protein
LDLESTSFAVQATRIRHREAKKKCIRTRHHCERKQDSITYATIKIQISSNIISRATTCHGGLEDFIVVGYYYENYEFAARLFSRDLKKTAARLPN